MSSSPLSGPGRRSTTVAGGLDAAAYTLPNLSRRNSVLANNNSVDDDVLTGGRGTTPSATLRKSAPGMVGKAKLNTIKITLTLVGAFLACWTPYYVMCMW